MKTWAWVSAGTAAVAAFSARSFRNVRKLTEAKTRSAVAEPPHPGPEGPQRVALIVNPVKTGAAEARARVIALAKEAGWPEPLVQETTVAEPGPAQARHALNWGADVVLVGGGDGTVRAVAGELKNSDAALGLVPLGTGNLLARNLLMDVTKLETNLQVALFGQERRIDTGVLDLYNEQSGAQDTATFLVIAGMGLDAEVIADTNHELKKILGWMAYSEAAVRHLAGKRKRVSISLDDQPEQTRKVRSVLFCNCGKLPAGVDFIPSALIDDGILDIVVMSPRSLLGWLALGVKIIFQHKRPLPVIGHYRSQHLSMYSPEPQGVQVDGDPAGTATAVRVQVEPHSLLVRVR